VSQEFDLGEMEIDSGDDEGKVFGSWKEAIPA